MSFWKIAWRNIEQRALASFLTALSMALGVAVMICVFVIHNVTVRTYTQDAQGYHLIVGGKGGELQLVMSTVFHQGQPLYPIPYSYYRKFVDGEFAGVTEVAIPICLGDSYEAPNGKLFRVVGTTPELFGKIHYGMTQPSFVQWLLDELGMITFFPTPVKYEFQSGGRNFKSENFYEAVVGSVVAAQSGLKVGDEVNPTHGIGSEGHKHEGFKIVGILKPTGTANDKAVFINIEGFYLLEGHALSPEDEEEHAHEEHAEHDHESHADEHEHEGEHADEAKTQATGGDAEEGLADAHDHAEHDHEHAEHDHDHDHPHAHEPLAEAQREVTSILVLCNSELGPMVLDTAVNKGQDNIAQAVAPARVVTRLIESFVGPTRLVLLVLTIMIVLVAAISILVSIYNSMSERSHDIAVMRALGASREAVMGIILVEAVLLSLLGGLGGVLLGHALVGLANPYVEARTGVTLGALEFAWQELVIIPALLVLASLVGLLPAITAYRTDVAKSLAGSR